MNFFARIRDTIYFAIAHALVTLYGKTWRFKVINRELYDTFRKEGKCAVLALWHDSLLSLAFFHRHSDLITIASDSNHGSLIASILEKWGFHLARGSSTRGGVKAVLKSIKLCREYKSFCAVTADGPKGPRHVAKDGSVFIAKKLDRAIIIVTISCRHCKIFSSWDRFILPYPFAEITVKYSGPIYVSESTEEKEIWHDNAALQKAMIDITG